MWYVPNSVTGFLYVTALVLIVLVLMYGLFNVCNHLPEIIQNKKKRTLLCVVIVVLLTPKLYSWSFSLIAAADKLLFAATGQVQLFNSPFVFPKSSQHYYEKSYCRHNFMFNNKPLNVTSRTVYHLDRPICGLFLNQSKSKYIGIPYKKLPDGTFAYWANLGTVYTSRLGPTDIVIE